MPFQQWIEAYSYIGVMIVLVVLIVGMYKYILAKEKRTAEREDAFNERYAEIAERMADVLVDNKAVNQAMIRGSKENAEKIIAALEAATAAQTIAYEELCAKMEMSDRLAGIEQLVREGLSERTSDSAAT